MKTLLFVLASAWLALSALAAVPGTVQVSATIAPAATNSPYGAQTPRYGYGGLLTGGSLAEYQNPLWYPPARRHAGMLAISTNNLTYYQLGTNLTTWFNANPILASGGYGTNTSLLGVSYTADMTADSLFLTYDGLSDPTNRAAPISYVNRMSPLVVGNITNLLQSASTTTGRSGWVLTNYLSPQYSSQWLWCPDMTTADNGRNIRRPNDKPTDADPGRWQAIPVEGNFSTPNMAALLSIVPSSALQTVTVQGYYSPGDGGSGTYVLTNSISGTNAYGGRVLALGGAQSWELLGQPYAEQFGAKGNGTGSDADQLNAAIAFAAERRIELVAAKTYRITKSVQWVSNSAINGRKTGIIRGAFDQFTGNRGFLQGSPLGNPGAYPQAPNVVATTTNISIAGLTVENENSSLYRPFSVLVLWGVSNVVIRDCVIGGSKTKGSTNNWLTYIWADDVTVSDSKFINGDGIFTDAFHVEGGSDYNISNCEMAAGDDAIALLNVYDHPIRRVNIVNCLLTSYQGHCIRIGKWNAVTPSAQTNWIEDISIANCQGQSGLRNGGLFIEDFATSGTNYTKLIRNVSIADVHISMNPTYETYGITNGYNLRVYGGSNVTFRNVTIEGGIIPSDIWYTRSLKVDGLKVSNSLYQAVYAKGIQDLSLRGLDLSNSHSSSLLYIESCGNVFVQDSKFNTASGTAISHIGTNTFLSVVGSVVNAGGSGITLTQNPATFVVTGSTFPAGTVSYAGSVYPTVTMVWGNTGIADVMQRALAIRQNSDSIINGVITQNTPNFTPLYIANRLDLGSTMEFSFVGGFPSWQTTNYWFQWLGGGGTYGRNTSTTLTEKSWVGVGVQHYDNTRGVVQAVRARSDSLRNYLELGYGDTNTQVMTDVSIGVAATNATRVATEILRAKTTGIAINLGGIAADPVRPLEVNSTSQGWLPPRLTTTQGDSISSPIAGEQWFDSTINRPRFFNGTRNYYGTPSLYGSTTQDPGSVAGNSTLDLTDVTGVTGVKVGDLIFVADPGFSSTLLFKAWAPSDDTVRIRLVNAGTSPVDLPSTLFQFIVIPK